MTHVIRRRLPPAVGKLPSIDVGTLPPVEIDEELLSPSDLFHGEQANEQFEQGIMNLEDPDHPGLDQSRDVVLERKVVVSRGSSNLPQRKLVKSPTRIRVVPVQDDEETFAETEPVRIEKKLRAKKTGVNPIEDIMAAMRDGEAVMIKREGSSSYSVSVIPNDIIVSKTGFQYLKKGITGKQYWREVLNPDFEVWSKKWTAMTYSEKIAYAEKHKISWEHIEDERLNVMRLTEAVRKAEHIEKYKEEYRKRSARNKIRG